MNGNEKIESLFNAPPPAKCDVKDCINPPKFKVIVALRVHDKHEPARSSPLIHVCGDHVDVRWDELVTEETWKRFCDNFVAIGRLAPVKKYSRLEIIPL